MSTSVKPILAGIGAPRWRRLAAPESNPTDRPRLRWIAALGLACAVGATQADTIEGRVVGVTDGDTITLLDIDHRQHKIRLDGIDAPESGQPFGGASKRHLSELAFDQQAVAECSKTDRYGRSVCRMIVGGVDVCLAQIQAGMAWHFTRYAKEQTRLHREQYAAAEPDARAERRGLCADRDPTPPWDRAHLQGGTEPGGAR